MRYKISNLQKIEKVFNKFKKYLPKAYHTVQLSVGFTEAKTYKTYQGAYATSFTIVLGSGYLNKNKMSEISIAAILGHEIGHHVLGHLTKDGPLTPPEEQDADHFGMYLCELAGFNREKVLIHWEEFEKARQKSLSSHHRKTHGTGEERVERLIQQDKYLKNLDW